MCAVLSVLCGFLVIATLYMVADGRGYLESELKSIFLRFTNDVKPLRSKRGCISSLRRQLILLYTISARVRRGTSGYEASDQRLRRGCKC